MRMRGGQTMAITGREDWRDVGSGSCLVGFGFGLVWGFVKFLKTGRWLGLSPC